MQGNYPVVEGTAAITAATLKYFRALVLPSVRAASKVAPPHGQLSPAERKEHDSHYPQAWLIAYFAFNGLRVCSQVTSASAKKTRRKLALKAEVADALVAAIVTCCVRTPLPDTYHGVFEVGARPDGACPSMSPTITTTFCLLQIALSTSREGNALAQSILDEASVKFYTSSSVLQSKSVSLRADMCSYAWRCLCEFSQGDITLQASGIADPRDLYGALMILWLSHREEEGLLGGIAKAALPTGEGARDLSSCFERKRFDGFIDKYWCGAKGESVRLGCMTYLIRQCYSSTEGAFGAPPASHKSRPGFAKVPTVVEAHTGMTYCATISLVLLGYFSIDRFPSAPQPHGKLICQVPPSPQSLTPSLRRYLCARQAHFGLEVDEYDEPPPDSKYVAVQIFANPGFQGRPNKDSDTCYSFWALGSLLALEVGEALMSESSCADSEWQAVDNFLGIEHPKEYLPTLHHDDSLAMFTLMSASNSASKCGKGHLPLVCKDAEATADPVHSYLGLAGLDGARHDLFPLL